MPTTAHSSQEIRHSEEYETDIGNNQDKWILGRTARKHGGKEEDKQMIKIRSEHSDDGNIQTKSDKSNLQRLSLPETILLKEVESEQYKISKFSSMRT